MAADGIVDPFKPAASPAGNGIVDPFRAPSPAVSAPSAPAATPKLQLPRTWGQAATDLGIGLGEGAVSATMAVPQLLNTATGGAVDRYLWKPVTGAVDRLAGGPGEGRTLAESSQDTRSFLDEHKSPQLRQAEQELADTQGFLPSAKKILTNPMLLGQQVAEQAPQFLVPASAARTVGARVLERAGAEALAKGTAKRVAAGMGAEEAAKLAMPAARRLGERAASKAAGRAVMATGGAIGASQASEQAQQEVMGLDQKVLDANPQYQQLRAQGLSDVDARRELAVTAGMKAAAIALPLDTLASGLTARLEGNIFRGTTGVNGVGQLLSRRGAAGVAKAAGKEGAEETLQEGGEQFAQNVGVQGVDPNKSLMDQVPEQAAIGGTIGAVLGGTGFAGSASLSRPQTHAVPNPGAAPGSLSDAANVLQQPATGPVGRAAQEAVRSGATAAAQATQATATREAAAAPAPAAMAPDAATPGPTPAPGPAPWADPTTGEVTAPSKGQLTKALSDYILDTYLQAGHMRVNAQDVANAWGVPKADVNRVRQAATKSATARVAAAEREAMQPAASPAPGFDDIAADIDRTHNAAGERLDQAIAPPENVDATDERIPEPAPAAPAGAGAQAAGATDAQPAAISDGAGGAAAQEPLSGGAADVAGDGAATDTLAPLTTETPNAEAPDQAAATTGPEGQPAGVAGEGGSPAVEPAAEGAAPQAAAESAVARPPAAAQPNQVAEPEPKTPRAPKAPRGGSGKAAGGSSPAQAVARIETVGSKGIRLHGDAEAIRAQLAAGGFKKRGTPQKGALRFDAADRQRIEAALAAATGKDSLKVAAPEANEDRQQQIQQGFADNKAAIATHKYKAGDTVTFVANGKTVTGTIAKGDKAGMVKDMGIFEVEYPGRNGMARATVGARFLSPAEPAVPTGSGKATPTSAPTAFKPSSAARKAESLRVKTSDGEVNGRTHVDQLVQRGFTQLASTRAGDKMVHTLSNAAGESQPVHARQLDYAREVAAKAEAPTVKESLTVAKAGPTAEDSSVAASTAQDRDALRETYTNAYEKAFPNRGIDRSFMDENADAVINSIESKDARALVSRNLGDPKAMPAARAVFESATGIKLPKGRRASEDAIYRWAGSSYEAEQARKAEAKSAAAEKKREPVQEFPAFANYREAEAWVRRRAEAFGGVKKYAQTEEYQRLLPTLRELAAAHNNGVRTSQAEAMAEVGVKEGDTVESGRHGMQTKRGWVDRARGKIFMKDGAPWVRMEDGGTVRISGRKGEFRAVPWSKSWLPPGTIEAPERSHGPNTALRNTEPTATPTAATDTPPQGGVSDSEVAQHIEPGEPPVPATAKEIAASAREAAPTVGMAVARKELLRQIDEAAARAPSEDEDGKIMLGPPYKENRQKVWSIGMDRTLANGLDVPSLKIVEGTKAFLVYHGRELLATEPSLASAKFEAERLLRAADWKAGGKSNGKWDFSGTKPADYVTLDVPGDGKFKVLNTRERLAAFRKEVDAKFKQPGAVKVPNDGTGESRSLRMNDATREKILSEAERVDEAAHEAATSPQNDRPEPTEGQIEAGNYKKGHVDVQGLDISIENPRGSTRSGVGENGKPWSHVMTDHYGYIRRTEGADGEQVDVYLGPHPESDRVYVVDQIDQKTGKFDEHKAMLGFDSEAAAVAAYKGNFDKGWKVGPVSAMSMDEFKAWLKEGDTTKPLQPVAETTKAAPQAAAADQGAANTKDAGEELWANRRNSTGKGLAWTDIADLNDTLKAREAVKSKVWPRPNYGELVEGGMPAPIAHVIKQMYDALATRPQTRGVPTDAQYQDYIAAVHRMRDAAFDWARQVMETTAGMDDKAAASVREVASKGGIDPAHAAAITSALRLAQARNYPVLDAVFPMPKKEDFREPSRFRTGEQGKANNALGLLLGGNKFANALQVGERSMRAAFKAVEGGWPAAKSGWEISFTIHQATGAKPEFFVVRKGTRRIVADGLATRAEAEAAAQAAYARLRTSGGDGAKAEAPVELRDARSGPARRLANEDVTSDQLRETFGFKGINFGNWMKGGGAKNAAERQAHLNHAYDAFHDLAEIMGLPPKAMSLNGTLGLAFGAQGSGGKRAAAAHFVPGVNEINLTREQGAGSLAHEWAHALDHYFAVQAGGLAAKDHPFLTEQVTRAGDGIRPEVRTAFLNIVQAMTTRAQTAEELAARLNGYQKTGRDGMEEVLRTARQAIERSGKGDTTAALEQFDELAKRLRVGDVGEGYVKTGRGRMDSAPQVVAQVANLVKETTGRKPHWTDALASYAKMVSVAVTAKSDNTERAARVRSDFAKEARKLEGTRKTPYWSTKLEMFARAFQSYVLDKLAAEGNRNHYLTRPQMSGEDFARLKADPETAPMMEAGDRYPRGAEREAINKAFDTLTGELKTRDGEDGRVVLFRRGADDATTTAINDVPVTPAQEAHRARIEQIATTAKSVWKGGDVPALRVVATPEQLPQSAKVAAGGLASTAYKTAAGMYDGRTIWIVASKHTADPAGLRKLLTTMAHEGVGHYGIDRIVTRELGEQAWAKIEEATERLRANPKKASPAIQKVLADVESRYSGADATTFAREFLAVSAEQGVRNSLLDRVVMALRRLVRRMGEALQNLPALRGLGDRLADLTLHERELRQLLVASDQYLRVGETQQQRVQSRAALAFNRNDQTLTPAFKKFFGDWERLATQRELDKAPVVDVAVPAAWRGKSLEEMRALMADALDRMVHEHTVIVHPQLGDIHVGRTGAKKSISTSRDPAKMLVVADLKNTLPKAVLAGFDSSSEQGVSGYTKLLLPIRADGVEMTAIFRVRHQTDGQWYYNTVAVADKKMRPGSYESPGALARPLGETPITGLGAFVRQPLQRVNPDTVSKVVDADGNPLPVYHGTAEEFDTFDPARSGSTTAHMTANLGTFFAESREKAQHYAENASQGVPAEERVIDAYLAIRKPYTLSLKRFMAIDSQEESAALRQKLIAEGYDGIHIPEVQQWIAFQPNQIKSASENRGTFDTSTGNIYFSRDDADPDNPAPKPRPFGDASASIETMSAELPQLDRSAFQKGKDWIAGKARDFEPVALGALQLRHVLELAADDPTLKQPAKAYGELYQRMDGDRNQMTQDGAAKVDALQKWARAPGPAGWLKGKIRPEAAALFKFMHAVTQLAVDPTNAYERLLMRDAGNEYKPWTKDLIKERIRVLRKTALSRSGDDKTRIYDEIKELERLPQRERVRQERYPKLVAQWNALSPEAKHHFEVMRDHYQEQSAALEAATIKQLEGLDIPDAAKRQALLTVRDNFRAAKVDGVYFPLTRFGDYWLSLRRKDGEYVFAKYETANEMQQAEKRWLAAGAEIEARGRQDNNYRAKDAPSGTFIGDLMGILKNAPDKTKDEIYQMYLKTLPALSLRKHGIHRNNVAGYTDDVPRAFASSVFHGAHQISKARYGWQLQATMEQMRERMEARRTVITGTQAAHGDALLGELNRRHDWIMNPTNNQLANHLTSIGFSYFLAASPASALVNLIQVPQIVLPVLSAQHGWGRTTRVLTATMRDAIRTGGHIDRVLTGEDLLAFKALQEHGTFQRSATHALAGISEGDQLRSSPAYAKVMNALSWMFHTSEVINREGTGMAAYRLAREKGQSFEEAVKYADEMTNGTHGDYSNANRARYMQGNTMKVLTQFKNYSLAMSWLWGRQIHQAFKGESPEVRAVARKTLTGMLGMTGLFAGVVGMPIFNLLRYGAMAAHAVGGDPDEPWDFMTEFRAWLAEHLGETAANLIADGAASELGANVASRVSMSDLWFRDADRQLEGEDAYNAMLQAFAGPLGGMIKNMYVGAQQFNEGHTERGIETMLPTFAKNAVKAVRYASQGVNTLRGDPIVADISAPQALIQAIGFQPTTVARQMRTNNSLYTYQQAILERRQALMNGFAMAVNAGDVSGQREAMQRIQKFNRTNPEVVIGVKNLRNSLRQRARFSAEADNGIRLNKKLAARLREDVGATASP